MGTRRGCDIAIAELEDTRALATAVEPVAPLRALSPLCQHEPRALGHTDK
jgi:hypothetical protein